MPSSNKSSGNMPGNDAQTEKNKQIVHRYFNDCWSEGRLNSASELLADNIRVHDPVFPNLNSGAQNVRNHIETCRRAFPDLKFNIDDTIAERNEVVVHWTARGTHKGDFLGMHPTNRVATVTGTSIYRLEHSRIVEEWAHWNLMTMMEQLGVGTSPRTEATSESRSGSASTATAGSKSGSPSGSMAQTKPESKTSHKSHA